MASPLTVPAWTNATGKSRRARQPATGMAGARLPGCESGSTLLPSTHSQRGHHRTSGPPAATGTWTVPHALAGGWFFESGTGFPPVPLSQTPAGQFKTFMPPPRLRFMGRGMVRLVVDGRNGRDHRTVARQSGRGLPHYATLRADGGVFAIECWLSSAAQADYSEPPHVGCYDHFVRGGAAAPVLPRGMMGRSQPMPEIFESPDVVACEVFDFGLRLENRRQLGRTRRARYLVTKNDPNQQ
jgi:hypothetical protein